MAVLDSFGITEVPGEFNLLSNKTPRINITLSRDERKSHLFRHCQLNVFKNRSVLYVLMLSLSAFTVLFYLLASEPINYSGSKFKFPISSAVFLYPVLGWFADARFGRYRVIKWSLRFLWMLFILYGLFLVLLKAQVFHPVHSRLKYGVKIAITISAGLSVGGYLVNTVQFGIDQLSDASSEDIKSFIQWYAWVWFGSQFIVDLTQTYLDDKYEVLIIAILLSIALCMDFFCNQWLVKEPESSNPLAVVFRVLKYAAKNKYPSLRSSFSYWDDKKYSRLDLAKTTFGGPFSTEQVEDVKTFLRILVVLFVGCFFASLAYYFDETLVRFNSRLLCGDYAYTSNRNWLLGAFTNNFGTVFLTVFIPVFEFTFIPLLKRHFNGPILRKFGIGMLFIVWAMSMCGVLEAVDHHYVLGSNQSIFCLEERRNRICHPYDGAIPKGYLWIMVLHVLKSFGSYLLLVSALEFLCAQSPCSMKGLLIGFTYACIGLFAAVNLAWAEGTEHVIKKWFSNTLVGCEALYSFVICFVFLLLFVLVLLAFKCYKTRWRGENQADY